MRLKAGLVGNASWASTPRARYPAYVPAPPQHSHTLSSPSRRGHSEARMRNAGVRELGSQQVEQRWTLGPEARKGQKQDANLQVSPTPELLHACTQPNVYLLHTKIPHVSEAVCGELAEFSGRPTETIHRASLEQIKKCSHIHHPQGGGLRPQESAVRTQHRDKRLGQQGGVVPWGRSLTF